MKDSPKIIKKKSIKNNLIFAIVLFIITLSITVLIAIS